MAFTDSFCVIRDCTSRALIGMGKVEGGVFLNKVVPDEKKQVHAVRTSELYYGRLGRPFREVFYLLAKDLDMKHTFENKTKDPYDVCLPTKQTRCPFSQSESNASDLFEFIHIGVRGAYCESSSYGAPLLFYYC